MKYKVEITSLVELEIINEFKFNKSVEDYKYYINSNADSEFVLQVIALNVAKGMSNIEGIGSLCPDSDEWCGLEVNSNKVFDTMKNLEQDKNALIKDNYPIEILKDYKENDLLEK